MRSITYGLSVFALALLLGTTVAAAPLVADPPVHCESCDAWNKPHEPFRVFGSTYYVGTDGLSAILLASPQGLILIDGGLPQSAPLIDENIRKLGLRTEDIRLILNSHAHFDHAGGIAALARASGAAVAASADGAKAMVRGHPGDDDPQAGFGRKANQYPSVAKVKAVRDGETLTVGPLAVTAHLTPGHTPGSTSWTWRACEGNTCLNIVYADSLTAVAAPGFRFTGDAAHPATAGTFRASIDKVAALPCDILMSPHPGFWDRDEKLAGRARQVRPDPFIDRSGCRAYAENAAQQLDKRLAQEGLSPTRPGAAAPSTQRRQPRRMRSLPAMRNRSGACSRGRWSCP